MNGTTGRPPLCINPAKVGSNGIWTGANPLSYSVPLLAVQLFLVVFTTRTTQFLLRPLKQPKVVAEIIGGMLLGPSFLGRSEAFTRTFFPDRGSALLDTVGMFGLMYVTFLLGLKMDIGIIREMGRKAAVIGTIGMVFQFVVIIIMCVIFSDSFAKEIRNSIFFFFLGSVYSITSFPVLIPILSDLNIINSELGRLSISASMTNDIFGWVLMISFIALQASVLSPMNALWATLSTVFLISFAYGVVRPLALRVIKNTPRGKPVDESYTFLILLGISVVGFLGDLIGANSFNSSLVFGLAMPDGPPLGEALVERLDAIASGLLLPLFYAINGLRFNVFSITNMESFGILQIVIIVGVVAKFVGTLLPSLYYKMSMVDALSLSLLMNAKGLVEVVTFKFWLEIKLIDSQCYAILMIYTVFVTALVTPLMSTIYNPSKRYMLYKRRTIQHARPDSELRILACVHNQSNVPTLLNLLEASFSSKRQPLGIYVIHLIQLVGRSAPILISHKLSRISSSSHRASSSEPIVNAFRLYENRHQETVTVHSYTAISPYSTVHDEICNVALTSGVSLIVAPFHKQPAVDGTMIANNSIRTVNQNILANAPCSVGILIDRNVAGGAMCTLSGQFTHRVGILFFGGDDDREALAYANRMARHGGVSVSIIRFLPEARAWEDTRERRMDEEMLDDMRMKNLGGQRVGYREVVVRDTEDIVGIIRNMENDGFDLLIAGMRHEGNPLLTENLGEWSECPELGLVGDLLGSADLGSTVSVLVIRQQPGHLPVQFAITRGHSTTILG